MAKVIEVENREKEIIATFELKKEDVGETFDFCKEHIVFDESKINLDAKINDKGHLLLPNDMKKEGFKSQNVQIGIIDDDTFIVRVR